METDLNDTDQIISNTTGLFSPIFQKNLTNSTKKKKNHHLSLTLLSNEFSLDQTISQSNLSRTNLSIYNDTTINLKS